VRAIWARHVLIPSLANRNNSLALMVPGQIIDFASKNSRLSLQNVFHVNCIPNSHVPVHICYRACCELLTKAYAGSLPPHLRMQCRSHWEHIVQRLRERYVQRIPSLLQGSDMLAEVFGISGELSPVTQRATNEFSTARFLIMTERAFVYRKLVPFGSPSRWTA
jgi:hypothetical protein